MLPNLSNLIFNDLPSFSRMIELFPQMHKKNIEVPNANQMRKINVGWCRRTNTLEKIIF